MRTVGTPAARLAVVAALAFWIALSLLPFPRPAPVPATAPARDFSTERALEHVRAIAQRPHPPGSAEHDRVRDYIRGALASLGLASELETGVAEFSRGRFHASGRVENIVARLPGAASTRPVMLVAHYDSTPRGPGAADDAHGVAVLLETLRALRGAPPLRNDVIFLITDGEEKGLLGAALFMREHPWRNQPAVVLNFEARGTGGYANMFETSAGNAWLIRDLQAAVPQAYATSFAYEVYRRMPNDTDLTIFKAGGLAGMNFAFIEHPEFYHRPQDDLAHLDPRSVQEQGRYALSLARRFGDQDLSRRHTGNAVYFPTRITPLIVYPASWVLPLAWIAAVALAAAAWWGWKRRARGLWMAVPLALAALLAFLVAAPAPGVSYLFEWPLLAAIAAFALLVTAPPTIAIGWRLAAMLLLPAPVLLLLLFPLGPVIVALGLRASAPVLARAAALMLIGLSPQVALALRRKR